MWNVEASKDFELSPIKAMELAAARHADVVSLAQGIPSFATDDRLREFAWTRVQAGECDKYSLPQGLLELREEIALALEQDGLHYDPEREIIATAGSIAGITASLLAATKPGDEVLVPAPTYASYLGCIKIAGCQPRYVPLFEDSNYDFDLNALERAVRKRTSAILYCSPNNPTGTVYSRAATEGIVRLAQERGLTIITDEVYKDFYYGSSEHFTPALVPEARDHVIRVCSFSKAFAMTGWRIGFLHTKAELAWKILRYHDAMVNCAPVVAQYMGLAALRFGDEILEKYRAEYKRRRNFVLSQLDEISHALDYQAPRATYFVFPRIKDSVPLARDSYKLAYDILEKARVALVPGVAFGPTGESHLRINFGRDPEDLERGCDRLKEYFRGGERIAVSRPSLSTPKQTSGLTRRDIAKVVLSRAARTYLERHSPTIVGIAGLRGKTVVKRVLHDLLGSHCSVRSNTLSYNTRIGLPLAVLELTPPQTWLETASFLPKLAVRTFQTRADSEFLVLEYGVSNADDGEALAKTVKPDWLIVTDLELPDLSTDFMGVREGVSAIARHLPPERLFWCRHDHVVTTLGLDLRENRVIDLKSLNNNTLKASRRDYPVEREAIGVSAQVALIGSVLIAEELGVPEDKIEQFLKERAR